MIHPIKLQIALTQACIDIHNANSTKDIEHLLEMGELFEKNGYTFPCWITAWIDMVKEDSLLNAEEHFKKPNNLPIEDNLKAKTAINSICYDYYSPKRYALFAIASEILLEKNEFNELGHEWHCKCQEFYSLGYQPNYSLFLSILNREISFWQESARNRISIPPTLKLTPSFIAV